MTRIIIDLQGAQTESRFRGIGRYALSLAKAIAQNRQDHEVLIALSGLFPETIGPIRDEFKDLLPKDAIRVWHAIGPTRGCDPDNAEKRYVSECMREAAILAMQPDVVLVTSMFEGFGDDAITSVGHFDRSTPTVAVLYDLIPLISPDEAFRNSKLHSDYYNLKVDSVRRCNALLAISESARQEAIRALAYPADRVTNISSGCDPRFKPTPIDPDDSARLRAKFQIEKPFIMYTGGADERKNLERLIQAFARLPQAIRTQYQLLLVGKMPELHVRTLKATSTSCGLSKTDVIFTGFVSDLELMQLYSSCELFVFPSLHEGFGLPPLEAMACGAPVVGSNATSLPEVFGRSDAMFDPHSTSAIMEKMLEVLTQPDFRSELIAYGLQRPSEFSWHHCAEKALQVLLKVANPSKITLSDDPVCEVNTGIFQHTSKRVLVLKLDHMGDLVLATPAFQRLRARYPSAHIDIVVGSWNLEAATSLEIFDHVYTLDFFTKKSSDAAKMPKQLNDLASHLPIYDLALDLRRNPDTRPILKKLPSRLRIGYATGDPSIDSALDICLPNATDLPHQSTSLNRESAALQMLRLIDAIPPNPTDYIVIPTRCDEASAIDSLAIFPNAGNAIKEWGTHQFLLLIELLEQEDAIRKIGIFVGSSAEAKPFIDMQYSKVVVHSGLDYKDLRLTLSAYGLCVANNSFGSHLASSLGLSVVGIYGGHETVDEWGPVFGNCRTLYRPMPCSPCHLPDKASCKFSFKCMTDISPSRVYQAIVDTLHNRRYLSYSDIQANLIQSISGKLHTLSNHELSYVAQGMALNLSQRAHQCLFVDISELVVQDAGTGIQRVVKSILLELLRKHGASYEILPVYATPTSPGFRVANKYLSEKLSHAALLDEDVPIFYQTGDVFLGLDFQPGIIPAQVATLRRMHQQGVNILFVVYDLLCLKLPQFFDANLSSAFNLWLKTIVEFDGALCISQATAADLNEWVNKEAPNRKERFQIDWFHIGADIHNSLPSKGMPENASDILEAMQRNTAFLMVGTLEPRKGHREILEAFDALWDHDNNVVLVIVGKKGWLVDDLALRILKHKELGKRLIWLQGASDEYLNALYDVADCLIAGSLGEGFGLPLVEAALHGLPIIARDLPVFREVAGTHAFYFPSEGGTQLLETLETWLTLFHSNQHPKTQGMSYLNWEQSTKQLVDRFSKILQCKKN